MNPKFARFSLKLLLSGLIILGLATVNLAPARPDWQSLQQQCTATDKYNPLMLCLPVTVTVIDEVNSEAWEQTPSSLLAKREPTYLAAKRRLAYTAEGKGKLLYKKDFSEFRLVTSGTPETTRIEDSVMFNQGYTLEGVDARPVWYHHDVITRGGSTVYTPFKFQILYPFQPSGKAEEATKNYNLIPLRVCAVGSTLSQDLYGGELPDEHIQEELVTPERMKQFVAAHGFQKSYAWRETFVPGRNWTDHRLTIKVVIGEPCGEPLRIAVSTLDGLERYCFSEASLGKLEFTLTADVTPASLADEVTWTLPDLQGSTRETLPPGAKGRTIKVTYTNLPKNNSDFGSKTIKAVVKKDQCEGQAQKEIRFFFPAFAKNNPGGIDPNWFYYWKQTSACVGPARFGGGTGQCSISPNSRDLGYYRSTVFDTVYYICDLRDLGADFPFVAKRVEQGRWADLKVTGIDTFGVACLHENAHYLHFTQWWKPYQTSDKFLDANHNGILDEKEKLLDKDGDLVPDALEEGLHLDPKNRNTYGIGPNGDDEEALCWFAEATWKIGSADKEDWAKPGKQWK
jgi:hypothetical protein